MPKYKVRLAREATESTEVVVEAANPDEAEDLAFEQAGAYGENLKHWAIDDGNMNKIYVPSSSDIEETDQPLGEVQPDRTYQLISREQAELLKAAGVPPETMGDAANAPRP